IQVKLLDSVVPGVSHQKSVALESQANRLAQPARLTSVAAESPHELAIWLKDLDSLVACIGDIHQTVGTDSDVPRSPERTGLVAGNALRICHAAPPADWPSTGVEHLQTVIPGVRDEHLAVWRDGYSPGLL